MSITMTSWLRHVAAARFSGRREARFTLSLARNRRRPIGSVVIEKSVRPETATPLTELIRRRRNIVEGANNARPVERALASTAAAARLCRLFFVLRRSNTICKEMKSELRRRRRRPAPQSQSGCKSGNYRQRYERAGTRASRWLKVGGGNWQCSSTRQLPQNGVQPRSDSV